MALLQRTVYVPVYEGAPGGFRTLTNSNGQSALPIFTTPELLDEYRASLGWPDTDYKEVGAREAMRHAVAHNLFFVVVNIGSPHALEIDQEEIKPLLTPQARRESSGPFAGVGRISSSMMQAVKATPAPGSLPAASSIPGAVPPPSNVSAPELDLPPAQAQPVAMTEATHDSRPPPPPGIRVSTADGTEGAKPTATFGSGSSVELSALSAPPRDELLKALAGILRGFPEVEWAALANVSRGPSAAVPTIGLRVDAGFRQRVNEIVQALRAAGDKQGASLDVLLLDDPLVMRTARSEGLVFYPWKR